MEFGGNGCAECLARPLRHRRVAATVPEAVRAEPRPLFTCVRCGPRPRTEFSVQPRTAGGFSIYCRSCAAERRRIQKEVVKAAAIEAYGRGCGCDVPMDELECDHRFGDGSTMRHEMGLEGRGGHAYLSKLKQQGWPHKDRHWFLCHACHVMKTTCDRNGMRFTPRTPLGAPTPTDASAQQLRWVF